MDILKMQGEIEKMHAEISKLMADTIKTNRENWWLPTVYGAAIFGAACAAIFGAACAFAKLLLH